MLNDGWVTVQGARGHRIATRLFATAIDAKPLGRLATSIRRRTFRGLAELVKAQGRTVVEIGNRQRTARLP
jgi:hypothetical protein